MGCGFWERTDKQVLVGILHVDQTTCAWAAGFRNLQIPGQVSFVNGMPFDMSRNVLVQQALEGGYQYVFFLDSDVIPPRDAILRLMSHRVPLISGLYCRRSPPHSVPVMIRNGSWVTEFPHGKTIEVDLVGSGCMLIHRSLLEEFRKAPLDARRNKIWFDWRVDLRGLISEGEAISEDFAFCLHARRQFGVKVLVDTSVQCKHVGLAQSTFASFVPMETTMNT